jgi:hypothetical protein
MIRAAFSKRIPPRFLIHFDDMHFDALEKCISMLDEIHKAKSKPSAKVAKAFHKVKKLAVSASFGWEGITPVLYIDISVRGVGKSKKQIRKDANEISRSMPEWVFAPRYMTNAIGEKDSTTLLLQWSPRKF